MKMPCRGKANQMSQSSRELRHLSYGVLVVNRDARGLNIIVLWPSFYKGEDSLANSSMEHGHTDTSYVPVATGLDWF